MRLEDMEEKGFSGLLLEKVKEDSYFEYPSFMERTSKKDIILTSCKLANQFRKNCGEHLYAHELLKADIPPVPTAILLTGLEHALEWYAKSVLLQFGAAAYILLILFLQGAAFFRIGYDFQIVKWMGQGFPKSLLICLCAPLLLMYILGLIKCIMNDIGDLKEARKMVTTDRHIWENEKKEKYQEMERQKEELARLSEIGGIPREYWLYGAQIWGLFKEGRADTVAEAINVLDDQLFLEQLNNRKYGIETVESLLGPSLTR